jgi:MSHA biogenesis protein MshO
MNLRLRRSAGFTLIEAIMVIVITGILAGIVAVFITKPVEGYVDSVRRAELTDNADVALRRIARDVRLALPNSLRTVPNGFEFIMTKSGGRYRDGADGSTGGDVLNFNVVAPGDLSFDVLGPPSEMTANDLVVVYNLGVPGSDAYTGNRALVSSIIGNNVTLASNPFTYPSPSARFQVIDKNAQVVRYLCDGTSLRRITECSLSATSCIPTNALLAGGGTVTASCPNIDYSPNATGRNGLLYISLTLTSGGESVTLFQQIHVDNSP